MRILAPALALCLVCSSCVVTDEIEFHDKVNYPPQFVTADPPNDVINYTKSDSIAEFTVSVWDPDEDDISYYDGRISVIEQLNSSIQVVETFSCYEPAPGESDTHEGGVVVTVTCAVTMRPSNDAAKNLLIKVELSDRGYGAGNTTPEDAQTIEVMWTYELLPQDAI